MKTSLRLCLVALAPLMVLVGASTTFAADRKPTSLKPTELTCEYLTNPLGLDMARPALSWKLRPTDPDARGQRQRAYHVVVASTPDKLLPRVADLWDSGRIKSDQSQNVLYAGKPLRPGQRCWWRVTVEDENGRFSGWSEPARWTVGPMSNADWTARWIGTGQEFTRKPGSPPPDNNMPDPWLRKAVMLDATPLQASIYVASVGYHEVWVNGRKVSHDVLMPAVTDHTKRARYVTYDLAPFLHAGQNVIGLWLGTSWSIFPPYRTPDKPASPIVIAQADLVFADGKTLRVATDESWKWHPSPNTTIGVWDFMHFGGERYDASQEVPDWCDANLDNSAWKPVKVFTPQLTLSAQKVESNRAVLELKPVALAEPKPGVYRLDFGRVFTGFLEANVTGQPGDQIEFQWSEREDQPMTHRLHSFYVIGPAGKGTFRDRFNYGVGRWIQVTGLRQKPSLDDFRGWLVRTDYRRTTHFECSNPLLNRIYETVLWTLENLTVGGYVVDCAQRERMGYGGDGHATIETAMDNYAVAAMYRKWSEDWRDVQGKASAWGVGKKEGEVGSGKQIESGNLPYTAPTYWGGGGPAWSGFCVTLPWELFRRTGDRRVLEENFTTIERWLAFVETKQRDNLLRRYGGEWDFLGDWLWPGAEGVNGDTRETLFFNNCYWVYNLRTAGRIAEALGRKAEAKAWRARADPVSAAIHQEFWNASEHSYVNGFQAYLSAALLAGVVPADQRAAVWQRLENEIRVARKGHFWGGITGGYFIIKNLVEAGRNDLMYEMASKEDYPGWGDLLRRGATTMWEDWEGRQSLSHSSYLHIGFWFVQGLAGLRPGRDGDGWKSFELRPACDGSVPLDWVKCSRETPYGLVVCNWRRGGGKTEIEITVPPNTTATFFPPMRDAKRITEAGQRISESRGVKTVRDTGGGLALQIAPDSYRFETE